jgi:hypothetical protein
MADPIYFFVGGDEYHTGIPARDLTQADLDQLDDEQREIVATSRLYSAVIPEWDFPALPSGNEGEKDGN